MNVASPNGLLEGIKKQTHFRYQCLAFTKNMLYLSAFPVKVFQKVVIVHFLLAKTGVLCHSSYLLVDECAKSRRTRTIPHHSATLISNGVIARFPRELAILCFLEAHPAQNSSSLLSSFKDSKCLKR